MQAKTLLQITARAICKSAYVNRATFYAHFLNAYDLFGRMKKQLQRKIPSRYIPGNTRAFSKQSSIPMLEYIRRNQCFYRIALQTGTPFP